MVLSSKRSETARPLGQSLPQGVEESAGNGLAKKNDLRVATRRNLEGLGYLGMLSASPTDIAVECFR